MPRNTHKNRRENNTKILKSFDTTFDSYNNNKMTKERMLKNCAILYKKLILPFPDSDVK